MAQTHHSLAATRRKTLAVLSRLAWAEKAFVKEKTKDLINDMLKNELFYLAKDTGLS